MNIPDENSKELIAPRLPALIEFFRNSPLPEADLDFERQPDYGRDIEM